MLINIIILIFALLKYTGMDKENIIFKVDKELKRAFKVQAIRNGANMTKVLKAFVLEYVKQKKK